MMQDTTSDFLFSGKAATLSQLSVRLTTGQILPMVRFGVKQFFDDPQSVVTDVIAQIGTGYMIVRSSCHGEDGTSQSGAGMFMSIGNVRGHAELHAAVEEVIRSYGKVSSADEVLVQPMAEGVLASGVAMTRDPETLHPYYIVNYTVGEGTDAVTSGNTGVQTYVCHQGKLDAEPSELRGLFAMLAELEVLTDCGELDVEFAITELGPLLFQVRPMIGGDNLSRSGSTLDRMLFTEADKIRSLIAKAGRDPEERTALLGLMPDWNPAEIIGVKPRPLAFSLYKELITDVNWASARFRYGYRDLRRKPLMHLVGGSPYIFIPYSIESFIPAALSDAIAGSTVDACCAFLATNTQFHDKIEFSVIPTCFTPSLALESKTAPAFGELTDQERDLYLAELRNVTEHIISLDGPFFADLATVPRLGARFWELRKDADLVDPRQMFRTSVAGAKMVAEVFAGSARGGFVATAILKSLESLDGSLAGLTDTVVGGTNSVGRKLSEDFKTLSKDAFLRKHGHVRPGTYDIRVHRYDEAPDSYFDWTFPPARSDETELWQVVNRSTLASIQRRFDECDLAISAGHFLHFATQAINAREQVKYLYGAYVSEALKALSAWGNAAGMSDDDLSFLEVTDFQGRVQTTFDWVSEQIAARKQSWQLMQQVRTPVILCHPDDMFAHEILVSNPNFITRNSTEAHVQALSPQHDSGDLNGSIVLIENADPGYDWIFTHGIAGFITAFGGENSHMSIRAREFSIPAAIGVGEARFKSLLSAKRIALNCAEHRIQVTA